MVDSVICILTVLIEISRSAGRFLRQRLTNHIRSCSCQQVEVTHGKEGCLQRRTYENSMRCIDIESVRGRLGHLHTDCLEISCSAGRFLRQRLTNHIRSCSCQQVEVTHGKEGCLQRRTYRKMMARWKLCTPTMRTTYTLPPHMDISGASSDDCAMRCCTFKNC